MAIKTSISIKGSATANSLFANNYFFANGSPFLTGTGSGNTTYTSGSPNLDGGGPNTSFSSVVSFDGGTPLSTGNVFAIGGSNLSGGDVAANSVVSYSTFKYADGTSPGYKYQLDDISYLFNGITKTFNLTYNRTSVAPNNPNQLTLLIGGIQITPSYYLYDYQNLPPTMVFNSGFYLSGNTINFATPPAAGMSFYCIYNTNNDPISAFNFKQSTFPALNIMFGQ
jgi:hypothetical protein